MFDTKGRPHVQNRFCRNGGAGHHPIPAQAQTCTRDGLKAIVANYFKAVETHNMSALETAPNLRITQNGSEIKLGEGFSKPAVSRNFNEPLSTRNAAARSPRPSLMKLRIPTRRHPPDEEESKHAVRRPAEAQVAALVPRPGTEPAWRRCRWCACRCARWFTCCGPLHRSRGHSCSAT